MTTTIVYDGTADSQEFGSEDFKKEGVEAEGILFKKGEITEVPDEVGELLSGQGKGVFKGFGFRKPKKGDIGYDDLDEALDEEESKQNEQADKTVDPTTTGPGASLQESTGDTGTAGMPGPGGGRISTT